MEIRTVSGEDLLTTALPLQRETFSSGPTPLAEAGAARDRLPYRSGDTTMIAAEAGVTLAAATAIPMRQNLRGLICPMAGLAGVVTQPAARRRGVMRDLLPRLLGEMRDGGCAVSTLYPFRPSFYERFGYTGLTQHRKVSFSPADLAPLLRADLPGEVSWQLITDGYDAYREYTGIFLTRQHGFAEFPEHRAVHIKEEGTCWLLTARIDGELAGALTYRIERHGGELSAGALLTSGPLARTLLLQFLARYIDQVDTISMVIAPGEVPELWLTDLTFRTETRTAFPFPAAPMARVLSLPALAGLPVGGGRVLVEIPGDPFLAGRYLLEGADGKLAVTRERGEPDAVLTSAGLAGLVYGVLDPAELALRGFGSAEGDAARALREMFPRRLPFLVAAF